MIIPAELLRASTLYSQTSAFFALARTKFICASVTPLLLLLFELLTFQLEAAGTSATAVG